MSHAHPTISAWQRDEHEGHYSAELHDWLLEVRWTPNQGAQRGSFHWIAKRKGAADKPRRSEEHYEEMSSAMAEAEAFAAHEAAARTAAIAAKTAGGEPAGH
jgi:hypothetical protein